MREQKNPETKKQKYGIQQYREGWAHSDDSYLFLMSHIQFCDFFKGPPENKLRLTGFRSVFYFQSLLSKPSLWDILKAQVSTNA